LKSTCFQCDYTGHIGKGCNDVHSRARLFTYNVPIRASTHATIKPKHTLDKVTKPKRPLRATRNAAKFKE